jgi:lipopolysaccharide transport system permease protein
VTERSPASQLHSRAMAGSIETQLLPPSHRRLVGASEILRVLIRKELKVKYKRSALGFLWSFVTPLALTGIYLFVFEYVYQVARDNYLLFLLSGILPWNFFQLSITTGTDSLVRNAPLIRKVFFPRQLLPISVICANLITFLAGFGALIVLVAISGRPVFQQLHWVVIAVVLQTVLAVGVVGVVSVWNVYLRDIAQLIGIFMTILFFGTPIVYSLDQVPDKFVPLILANPLSPIMEIYQAALFRAEAPNLDLVALAAAETAVILVVGVAVFRRHAPLLPKEL